MRRLIAAAAALFLLAGSAFADVEGATYNPGNAAARSALQGCLYRASPVTAVDGQQLAAGCDANGNMTVTLSLRDMSTLPSTVGTGILAAGNVAQFKSALPTYIDGQYGAVMMDVNGNLRALIVGPSTAVLTNLTNSTGLFTAAASAAGVPLGTRSLLYNGTGSDFSLAINGAATVGNTGLGVAAVEEAGRTYTNITTATTTTVKSGKGFLHTLCLNTVTATATVTAFDNTAGSGSKIFTITNPAALLGMGPICATYDIAFTTGLTLVTTGVQDITASWR